MSAATKATEPPPAGSGTLSSDPAARRSRALLSLRGLSTGDGFGERFFGTGAAIADRLDCREPPPAPWPVTDDTCLSLPLVESLVAHGEVREAWVAQRMLHWYQWDRYRGYGYGMHELFGAVMRGEDHGKVADAMFGGTGSMGNGGAMRVAPVGAWFADDLDRCVHQATTATRVTHRNPEGIAGGVAVAVATALRWRGSTGDALIAGVIERTGAGQVRDGLALALGLGSAARAAEASATLGNGSRIIAQDTVPLCVWMLAHHGADVHAALWNTVEQLGDRDTTCAIVGGMAWGTPGADLGAAADWPQRREGPDQLFALTGAGWHD